LKPHEAASIRIKQASVASLQAGEIVATAVAELGAALAGMTASKPSIDQNAGVGDREIVVEVGEAEPLPRREAPRLFGDSFAIARTGEHSISIRSGSERGLIHAVGDLLGRLGASFAPGAPGWFPRIEATQLLAIEPYAVTPSFSRRAFVSDILTWNYHFSDRLELHFRHDREFIPWMARRGINAFSYIRHAHDTRLRIDEIAPALRAHGIAAEYGGHVLQILLPRERFESDPTMFPADDDGNRAAGGNLCVSNQAAIDVVRDAAIRYVADYPENELLHIWGADVRRGGWCRCGTCRDLAPQHQYMKVVNAIAEALAQTGESHPVAFLAYHDTIDPDPGLRPLPNVRVEWAPRERCYSHAIDDPACDINPRYFESLKRYVEIFEGRCDVFEYYTDAILFGGLAFASPGIIARDVGAYHALGINSISCLTFGAYSLLAYPVNLETFVRCTRDVSADSDVALNSVAQGRHPDCAREMTAAYRMIRDASAMVLDYADVMQPSLKPRKARRKRAEITAAAESFRSAIDAAEMILRSRGEPLARAEQQLWTYSGEVLEGIVDYLEAKESIGRIRAERGDAAIKKIAGAVKRVRMIDLELKGTWGAYDLEWIREIWLNALRQGLEESSPQHQEMA
jgi:hypothetical protein